MVTPGGVENNSLEVRPGQEAAVEGRVLWNTIDPLMPGKAAPATLGRRTRVPIETAAATATRLVMVLSEEFTH